MTAIAGYGKPSGSFRGIVHYADSGTVVASCRGKLLSSTDGGATWRHMLTLSLSLSERLKASTGWSRRCFRAGVHHVLPLEGGDIVIFAFRGVYTWSPGSGGTAMRCGFRYPGSRPLFLSTGGGKTVYFGEYRGNPERSPVHIFGSDDGGRTWDVACRVPAVRHVHGVFADPHSGWIWFTTGDDDGEAGIWVTPDRFATVEKVAGGSQQMRAVQLLFTPEHVYYGSDTPHERNFLYRMSRRDFRTERLQEVEGSVFYGCTAGPRIFFSTVCEPSPVNRSPEAVVWESIDGETWRRFITFRKDALPMKLFQYGQVRFPAGPGTGDAVWLTPFATEHDQISMKFPLSE